MTGDFTGKMSTHAVTWDQMGEASAAERRGHRARPRGGGGCGKPKLTDDQVRAIRKDPRMPHEIAAEYGITREYAWKVQQGETHKNVR